MKRESKVIYHGKRNFLGQKDLVISYYTGKCEFKCSFCELPSRSSETIVSIEDIAEQIDWVFEYYANNITSFQRLSVGNEGSILNVETFPQTVFNLLLERSQAMNNLKVLSLETRLEYVTKQRIEEILVYLKNVNLDITTGLETSNDYLRNVVLNKYISRHVFEEKVQLLGKYGIDLTCYVMLKPDPNMTEEQGIEDALTTVHYLKKLCDNAGTRLTIYLNPTYIAKNSKLNKTIDQQVYQPPKIQSIVRTLIEIEYLQIPIYVGLWSEGLANPGGDLKEHKDFEKHIYNIVKKFNKTQDYNLLYSVNNNFANQLR